MVSTLDVGILTVFVAFICWKGLREWQSQQTTDDFFLANRSLTWPLIGLSLFSTNISTGSIIGLSGSGYESGIAVFNYELIGALMLVVFAIFIVPLYLQNRLTTVPEYLERRFDNRSRMFFSIIALLVHILVDIAGALYAGSLFLDGLLPGVDFQIVVFIIAFITGLYTMMGGFRAVIATDYIQAVLLLLGVFLVSVMVHLQTGSWASLQSAVDPSFLSLVQPSDDPFLPWPALLVSLPILAFYFICTSQYMVQRILGATSVDDARKGAIFAGFLKIPLLFLIILPAVAANLLYPDLPNANAVFPTLIFDVLPSGILGIVLTGILAALMSSIDSALTAISSIATMDLYAKWRPKSSQRHLVRVGQWFILLAVIIASLWAPFIDRFPTLWEYLQVTLSYVAPPVVSCFLFGIIWKNATADGAFASLCIGTAFGAVLMINNHFLALIPPFHYLYAATATFLASAITFGIVSLNTSTAPSVSPVATATPVAPSTAAAAAWYQSYQFFGVVVCTLCGIVLFFFW